MSGPPNVANGRAREPMRFGRKACSASFVTSIGGPLNRIVIRYLSRLSKVYLIEHLQYFCGNQLQRGCIWYLLIPDK